MVVPFAPTMAWYLWICRCVTFLAVYVGYLQSNTFVRQNEASYGEIGTWCTMGITDMSSLFASKQSFNGDISRGDVSSVTRMDIMFQETTGFIQPLNGWNSGLVT